MKTLLAQITNPVISESLGSGDGGSALGVIIGRLFQAVTLAGGLALFIYLVWGGISWITAGGDPKKVDAAKNQITHGVIGMAILVAAAAIAKFLNFAFGFDLLNPSLPALR